MRTLTQFVVHLSRRARIAAGTRWTPSRVVAILRALGPYAVIELVLPGGTLLALILWLCRRHWKAAAAT